MSPSASTHHDTCLTYLPIDRRLALARGEDLPERTRGAGLFADISGFTALAEALVQALGAQRGAEELTRQLDWVYGALIGEVDRYGGSVIGFSGDAITCWFAQDDGRRATAAALAMQRAMQMIEAVPVPPSGSVALGLKAAIATGVARRFVVGDPTIQRIDVLAGQVLDRLALAEQQAGTGEVIMDAEAAARLDGIVRVQAWRAGGGRRYALVAGLTVAVEPTPWPAAVSLPEEEVRSWLLPAVFRRMHGGQADFLADLRPAVALFLRFGGIEYHVDPAARSKLDAYVRWVQQILKRVEGTLIQVTIGDKGSYLYAAFGAPIAHDDDATRAVVVAMTLCAPPPELAFISPPQIGISLGRMRAGPYGGPTRRTYGVLGDEVNVAARLMQAAEPGQVLMTGRVIEATRGAFEVEPLAPVVVKGKRESLAIFALQRQQQRQLAGAQHEASRALPLVGREAELAQIERALEAVQGGTGRVVAIVGEAGVGKSRVVAEVLRRAGARGFVSHLGEGQSYGTNAVYLAWHTVWRGFFGVDADGFPEAQIQQLAEALARINPSSGLRLPLLGVTLNLAIPDNDLTRSLTARERKELLESLLVACVRSRAQMEPLLFVLEDCHWLDPLSLDLVEVLVHAVADLPVLLVLAYRPLEQADAAPRLPLERVAQAPGYQVVRLSDFTPDEAARLIGLKLRHPENDDGELPAAVVEQITARAGGNPFHIEEILNYLRDRGLDPRDPGVLEQSDLPESLHSLILSRIDHLGERQQVVLKVASVVGRQFIVRWLWGAYPDLGEVSAVRADLDRLSRLDITPLDTVEPELRYLFRHVLTQEVVYESQPYGTRASLHENLGRFLEVAYQDRREQYLDLLAYHYGRSENLEKQRHYYRAAGEHAARRYANAQAVTYFSQALALTPESGVAARFDLVLARMQVFAAQGARAEQAADLDTLADLAERLDDVRRVEVMTHRAEYHLEIAEYDRAVRIAQAAARQAREIGASAVEAWAYQVWGGAEFRREHYADAREPYDLALALAQTSGSRKVEARTLNGLGVLAGDQGDYPRARALFEQSLRVYRELGDPWFESVELNNLGLIASYQGDLAVARTHLEQALRLAQATGHPRILGTALARLGDVACYTGDYDAARTRYEQALPRCRAIRDHRYEVHILCRLGLIASVQGDHDRTLALGDEALAVARPLGQPRSQAYAYLTLGHASLGLGQLDEATAAYQQSATMRREIGQLHLAVEPLAGLARVEMARGDIVAALAHVEEILAYLQVGSLDGTDERLRISLTCFQVLQAVQDERASAVLARAQRELLALTRAIDDAVTRRSLLENVPWHREIVAAGKTLPPNPNSAPERKASHPDLFLL